MGIEKINLKHAYRVIIVDEKPCLNYCFKDEFSEKETIFLFFKKEIKYPAGYYGWNPYDGYIKCSKEELISRGYKVYSPIERIKNNVCYKSYVEIYFIDGNTTNIEFNTYDDAKLWAENNIDKKFITINNN